MLFDISSIEAWKSHLRCGLPTMKFVCPKMNCKWDNVAKNQGVYVTVIILAQLHPVVEWFISTLNRNFVLIPDVSVILMNGIPLKKYS